MNQKLMMVWKYDLPPYYLVGEIEEMNNSGACRPKGYTSFFNPAKILPYDDDRIEALKALGNAYDEKVRDLTRQCMTDARKLFFIDECRMVDGKLC